MAHTTVTIRIEKELEIPLDGIYTDLAAENKVLGAFRDLELYRRSGTELVAKINSRDITIMEIDDEDDDEDYETDEDD